jgi:NADPH2:quinone reductase
VDRLSQEGSLFLTRPTMFHHIQTRDEMTARTDDLFDWIASGRLDVEIGGRIAMSEAAEAHRLLESRQTVGKLILLP